MHRPARAIRPAATVTRRPSWVRVIGELERDHHPAGRMPRHTDPRLDDVTSASLCDAMDELFDQKAHVRDLISPTPGRILFGPASTIRFVPVREDVRDPDLHSYDRLFYEAVQEPREGQVLVIDTSGHFDLAIVGGKKATRLDANNLAGMVADCRFRDFDEIADLDLSCWCRGGSPKAGSSNLMPVGANVPAVIGDTTILPGDWIYADNAGAVAIPDEHLDDVLDAAVEKEKTDAAEAKEIRDEDPEAILARGSE